MKVGDIVRFREIVDPGDQYVLMQIEEERGDRVLVRDLIDLPIQPTHVYPIADLERASLETLQTMVKTLDYNAYLAIKHEDMNYETLIKVIRTITEPG